MNDHEILLKHYTIRRGSNVIFFIMNGMFTLGFAYLLPAITVEYNPITPLPCMLVCIYFGIKYIYTNRICKELTNKLKGI
jgi:hypothetical protein